MPIHDRATSRIVCGVWRSRHAAALRLTRGVRTQAQFSYSPEEPVDTDTAYGTPAGLATPKQLARYLDEFVVGQEKAKKVLSVAVFNHYNRVRANLEVTYRERDLQWAQETDNSAAPGVASALVRPHSLRLTPQGLPLHARRSMPLFEKSNVLVIGPTGSGKTLLAKTLARVLDVPFSVNDATSFTQAGYIGDDVDMCIHRLLQAANYDPARASIGIVYIDEVDKIAKKSSHAGDSSRDVGGEGVQQSLLRMMEGSVVTIHAKGPAAEVPPISPDSPQRPGQRPSTAPRVESYSIDTSNILFILSGAFSGLENIIKRRVSKGSIGFTAPLAEETSKDFMPFFTPNKSSSGALDLVETTDLVQYGFIPEFIGRLPSLTTLSPLTPEDLRRVLTDVRGSLISQYTALFGYSGVEIRFSSAALDEICLKAAERGGGARALRGIMENLLLDAMYEVPGSDIRHILVTADSVKGTEKPLYWMNGDPAEFWALWAKGEEEYHGKGKY